MTAERQGCSWERIFHLVHIIGYFCQSLLHFLHITSLFLKLKVKFRVISSMNRYIRATLRSSRAAHAKVTNDCGEQVLQWIQQPAKQIYSTQPPVHTPAWGFWQHISDSLFLFSSFPFPFRLLALAKGCKGAEPWSWQDTFLFPCVFPPQFPVWFLGELCSISC